MSTVISYYNDLMEAKKSLEELTQSHSMVCEKVIEVIELTRALHFKYQFMGCLFIDEGPGNSHPKFVSDSVLRLYKSEIQKVKELPDAAFVLDELFNNFKYIGYDKISQLMLGTSPESLIGPSIAK